jgi:hypothetical protein
VIGGVLIHNDLPAAAGATRRAGKMNTILKRLRELADFELFNISEAIDLEMQRREEAASDTLESARRRAIERQQSYRRRTGAFAPPVKAVGLGRSRKTRRAA